MSSIARLIRIGVVAIPLLSIAPACLGDSIKLDSTGTATDPNQTNNWDGPGTPTIMITKNPAWADPLAGSQWVSFGDTGVHDAGHFSPANGTIVDFVDRFWVSGTPLSGTLSVMADDSTSVWLNNTLLLAEAPQFNNHYVTCSDFKPGCLASTMATVNLESALRPGWNTLKFDVAQRHGDSFGLDYAGVVNSRTPEPATLGMLGLGLAAFSLIGRRRLSKQ